MNKLQNDILHYAHYSISVFILIQLWSSYQIYIGIQNQYSLIAEEALLKEESSQFISDQMWLNESFLKRFEQLNDEAAPFLSLIKSSDSRDLRFFQKDILVALDKTSRGENRLSKIDYHLLDQVQIYPRLATYITQYFYETALLSVGTLHTNCCCGFTRYQPLIEETEDNYVVYPNYYEDRLTFSKLLIDGDEVGRDSYDWTPEKAGSHVFDVKYKFIDDMQKLDSIKEQFVLFVE